MSTETDKKQPNDLNHLLNTRVRMVFTSKRSVEGILRGWDHFTNLVLDDAVEVMAPFDGSTKPGETRKLGQVICRAIPSCAIFATEGMVEIENPFLDQQE